MIMLGAVALPINMTFEKWSSQIRIDLPNINFPYPYNVEYWRDWAVKVINNNNFTNAPLPTKLSYPKEDDWRKWGAYFINYVYNLN